MKVVTVVGARPQFIKAAVVSRALRKNAEEILVHTGQHYDANMSDVFFSELNIPKPDYNLGISGGSHADMTGRIMIAVEEILRRENPDRLLVYGDTNSTLAATLAAVKLQIPVCHVEAGNRLGTLSNPEEVNRICTDHVSSQLFACTQSAMEFLIKENLSHRAYLVGDPMYDAFLYYMKSAPRTADLVFEGIAGGKKTCPNRFYYMTCHRQENTDTDDKLDEILKAMNSLDDPTVFPVHPRNIQRTLRLIKEGNYTNIVAVKPVGYLESIALVRDSLKIVTDSGGLQREAFFAGKQCVTVFESVVWPETMVANRNQLAKPDAKDILRKLGERQTIDTEYAPFGDGRASEKIVKAIIGKEE